MRSPSSLQPSNVQACMTPPGSAALATLTITGPAAWHKVRESFRPRQRGLGHLPEEASPGQFWLGNLGSGHGDEVVVALKQVEPVPRVDIHCHGGFEVVRYLMEHLEAIGFSRLSWQEMIWRTESDPCRAAALIELAQAPTVRTASILLDQVNGGFTQALANIRSAISKNEYQQAQQQLNDLAGRANLGRHLTKPWRVVLAGAPNVGKSSLANRLAGYIRSVVAPTPGTTRDVVTTQLAHDGWPVEIADTAGIREAGETLEGQGVALARSTVANADLCLWLLDASTKPVWPDFESDKLYLVINKMDLASAWDLQRAGTAMRVSAETGEGVADLGSQVARWLVPDPPAPGSAVPFTEAICSCLEGLAQSNSVNECLAGIEASLNQGQL